MWIGRTFVGAQEPTSHGAPQARVVRTGFQEQDCSKSQGQQEHQLVAQLSFEQTCIYDLKPGADNTWQTAGRWCTPYVARCCWNTSWQRSWSSSRLVHSLRAPMVSGCSFNCGMGTRTWNISMDPNEHVNKVLRSFALGLTSRGFFFFKGGE